MILKNHGIPKISLPRSSLSSRSFRVKLLFDLSKTILWYVPLYQWPRLKHLFHPVVEQVSLFLVYPKQNIRSSSIERGLTFATFSASPAPLVFEISLILRSKVITHQSDSYLGCEGV